MAIEYLTKEGFEKLKNELEFLSTVKRKEIIEKIDTARAFGDLKENAEYHAAKEAQKLNEIRVGELSQKLSNAQILDESKIPKGEAYLGSSVTLYDYKYDEEITYKLVSESEANIDEDKLSVSSPVGKALLQKKPGDEVTVKVPAGTLKYKVLKIER